MSVSPRTHLALFQKYRWGTSSRAGPPCSGSKRLSLEAVSDPGLAVLDVGEGQVGCVPAVAVGGQVPGRGPYSSRRTSTDTPVHSVPSLDHLVTQWMSTVTVRAAAP